jgi:Xaa-Pro aminopeptidase
MHSIRIQKLKKRVKEPCFIEGAANLFYLTGMDFSKGRLFVTPEQVTLFVDGRYFERAKKEAPCSVALWEEQKKITEKKIAFDQSNVSYAEYLILKKMLPHLEVFPIDNPVASLRNIKDKQELIALKKAAELTWAGYKRILTCLKEGVTEEALATEFKIFCLKQGASGFSFEPIIAFGENSAYPHYRPGGVRLQKNQVVLIDVGAIVDHYCADMTRIHHFGTPDPKIVHFEKLVAQAKKKAIEHVKPGVQIGFLDQLVQDEFDRANVKPLYTHNLGHGVGLEAHEFPKIRFDGEDRDVVLEEGMVFTIEPGLYQPGVGGVRLEDTLVVTAEGSENFFRGEDHAGL